MSLYYDKSNCRLHHGNCLEILPLLADHSVDTIVSDPPYPEVDRDYGRMSEADWHEMMREVVTQSRRILKPSGSAVFILQPNMEKLGRMRSWLWEFMAWTSREWNMVQDAWWWNITAIPQACSIQAFLLRPSLKACVWLGNPDCHRNQDNVLWHESLANAAVRTEKRAMPRREYRPSGHSTNREVMSSSAVRRGGVSPMNVLPISNGNSTSSGGAFGHGAATPDKLCDFWIRYLTPPKGIVCDPFCGSGTVGVSAIEHGHSFIGIEKEEKYCCISVKRIAEAQAQTVMGF